MAEEMKRTLSEMSSGTSASSTKGAQLQLTQRESELFDLIMEAVAAAGWPTVVRVAGGWVRDKLLGSDSDDIDIALDDKLGFEFATLVCDYISSSGEEINRPKKILANPEQSKHLETATVCIRGISVDFVNLRSETYCSESRIPTMTFGTAAEDASRRDFTVNALFYNLNTKQVEDLCHSGLSDLRDGILRTPKEPLETFTDDPLRILRAIRFASRYTFRIVDEMSVAIMTPSTKQALMEKVSRERVGLELEGMLSGKSSRPALALSYLFRLNLWDAVFLLPPLESVHNLEPSWMDTSIVTVYWANILLCVRRTFPDLVNGFDLVSGAEEVKQTDRCQSTTEELSPQLQNLGPLLVSADSQNLSVPAMFRLVFLSAAQVGIINATYMEKRKTHPLAAFCVREGIKFKNADMKDVTTILQNVATMRLFAGRAEGASRVDLGLLIRELKSLWGDTITVACALDLAETFPHIVPRERDFFVDMQLDTVVQAAIVRFEALRRRIHELGLSNIWELRPLIDGKSLATALGLPPGPAIGRAMEEQIKWQLAHPCSCIGDCVCVSNLMQALQVEFVNTLR